MQMPQSGLSGKTAIDAVQVGVSFCSDTVLLLQDLERESSPFVELKEPYFTIPVKRKRRFSGVAPEQRLRLRMLSSELFSC